MYQFIQSIKIYNPTGNNVEGLKFEFFPGQPLHFVGDGAYCLTCKESDSISIPSTCFFYNGTNYPNVDTQGVITNAINTIPSPVTEIYFSFLYTYKNSDNTVGTGNIFSLILNNLGRYSNWRIIFGNIYDWQTYPDNKLKYDISLNPLLTGESLFYTDGSIDSYIYPFYVDIDVSNMSISDLNNLPDGTELSWNYLPEAKENYGPNNDLIIKQIVPCNSAIGVSPDSPIQIYFNNYNDLTIPDEFSIYVTNPSNPTTWIDFKCRKNITFYEDSYFGAIKIWLTATCRKWSYRTGIENLTDSEYFDQYHNYYLADMLESNSQYYIKIPADTFTTGSISNKETIISFKTSNYPVSTSTDWYDGPGTVGAHTGGTGHTGNTGINAQDPGYTDIYNTGGTGGTGPCSDTGGEPGLPGYYSGGTGGTGSICGSEPNPPSEDNEPLQQITFDVSSSSALTIDNKRLTIDLTSTPLKPNTKYVLHVEDGAILSMSDDVIKVSDIHFTTGSK